MTPYLRLIAALTLCGSTLLAFASDSPVGLWRTIDDKTNKEKSLVRIVEQNGELRGTLRNCSVHRMKTPPQTAINVRATRKTSP